MAMPQADRFSRDQARWNVRNRPYNILTDIPDRAPLTDVYSLEALNAEPPPYRPPADTSMSPNSDTDSDTRYSFASTSASADRDRFSNNSVPVDWFQVFLDAQCEVQDCMRYERVFQHLQVDSKSAPSLDTNKLRAMGLDKDDIMRIMDAVRKNSPRTDFSTAKVPLDMILPNTLAITAFAQTTSTPFPGGCILAPWFSLIVVLPPN